MNEKTTNLNVNIDLFKLANSQAKTEIRLLNKRIKEKEATIKQLNKSIEQKDNYIEDLEDQIENLENKLLNHVKAISDIKDDFRVLYDLFGSKKVVSACDIVAQTAETYEQIKHALLEHKPRKK